MKKTMTALALALGLLTAAPAALAASPGDALGACFVDSMTGKDRKDIGRWLFMVLAAHPDLRGLAQISDKDRDETNRLVGALITKLMTESCVEQARVAMQDGGSASIKNAFGLIGQIAMQDLIAHDDVKGSLSGFVKYMDKKKFDAAFAKDKPAGKD